MSAAEASIPATANSKKKAMDADDRMRQHSNAADHHDREEQRLRNYHLDYKENPVPGSIVLLKRPAGRGAK